jgi:hypothetical protein
VDSGPDEQIVATNGKIIGAVDKSINPVFAAGYFTVAMMPEMSRQYLDDKTPTCKGLYKAIATIYVG